MQLQVQPLNSEEIKLFALNFNMLCYGEEIESTAKQVRAFEKALSRSPDAKLLAKTPLLLTMMLFINRSKKLPDKRHELYEECLKSLLALRPDLQKEEGVQPHVAEWVPEGGGPTRMQTVSRLAYELQFLHSGKQRQAATSAVVLPMEAVARYLPIEWENRERQGFLFWLCQRAGVMIGDTQNKVSFTHLSFQEFLAAWHLNSSRAEEDDPGTFYKLGKKQLWWETLLMWAALLNDQSSDKACALLRELIEGEQFVLAGMVLADGIGTDSQMSEWSRIFARQMGRTWLPGVERCFLAWQSSRQSRRHKTLVSHLLQEANACNWVGWLRISQVLKDIGARERLLYLAGELPTRTPLLAIGNQTHGVDSDRVFAGGRSSVGADILWPGYPAFLFNLWPSERRRMSLDLQRMSSLGFSRAEIVKELRRRHAVLENVAFIDKMAVSIARELRVLFRNWVPEFISIGEHDLGYDSSSSAIVEAALIGDLARTLARVVALDFSQRVDIGMEIVLDVVNSIFNYEELAWEGMVEVDHVLEMMVLNQNIGRFGDRARLSAYLISSATVRASLCGFEIIDGERIEDIYIPINLFISASRSSVTNGRVGRDDLNLDLDAAKMRNCDDLWIAFARHIVRESSQRDRKVLEEAARFPERRDGTLSRILRFMIRGDVLLSDGIFATMDDLCASAGLPFYPMLDDMPDELMWQSM